MHCACGAPRKAIPSGGRYINHQASRILTLKFARAFAPCCVANDVFKPTAEKVARIIGKPSRGGRKELAPIVALLGEMPAQYLQDRIANAFGTELRERLGSARRTLLANCSEAFSASMGLLLPDHEKAIVNDRGSVRVVRFNCGWPWPETAGDPAKCAQGHERRAITKVQPRCRGLARRRGRQNTG